MSDTCNLNMDLLLIYLREDGLFARFLPSDGEWIPVDASVREMLSEDTLFHALDALVRRVSGKILLDERRITVALSLSRKVEVLKPYALELLRGFVFADSVSVLKREELFYRGVSILSKEGPKQVLYCDTRETRLFTAEGEFPLAETRSGGNGFYDWMIGFVENENDSFAYYMSQLDRLRAVFRVYRCFSSSVRTWSGDIFPKRGAQPLLEARPRLLNAAALSKFPQKKRLREREADAGSVIVYSALTPSDRAKVDRRYPALYRAARDKFGRNGRVSIGDASSSFAKLFDGIHEAPISDLVVVGYYADFPLTTDFLSSLPQRPRLSFEKESRLLLEAMEQAMKERIGSSRLSLSDIDGEEIVLWEAHTADGERCPEKRVCFAATLRERVSWEDWKKKIPLLPYTVELDEVRSDENHTFRKVHVRKSGDLREYCYKRMKDGSYRLRLPVSEREDGDFRTVLLGIGATPVGVCCHLLEEVNGEDSSV